MSKEFNEESKASRENNSEGTEYVYKNVIKNKEQRRTWSVVSVVLAALSVILCYFSWVGLVLGVLAIAAALISRKNLGYFDKLTLAGIIIAIFGVVFAITGLALKPYIDILFS